MSAKLRIPKPHPMNPHERFMLLALSIAPLGRGWTSPNPIVGAVVVKGGKVVGTGFHEKYGGPHAEVHALREAGKAAKGGTLFCTLEPCNHHGKTPPCVDAILAAGIKTVVYAASDPNKIAAGGARALKKKKVAVIGGVLAEEAWAQNAPFFKRVGTGLPFVTAKWAMSADGKIATRARDSKWITGPKARAYAHHLRATHDAVLIGIGTVLSDAPLLTARLGLKDPEHNNWQPRRVILDSQARTPLDAPLWTAENGGPVTIAVSSDAPIERVKQLKDKGAEIINVLSEDGRLPVREVLKGLAKLGVMSILVEGGAEVLGSFLDAKVVDRTCAFIAPKILGGRDSISAVRGTGVKKISDCLEMHSVRTESFPPDILIEGKLGAWDWLKT